jgi:hypothetical protein
LNVLLLEHAITLPNSLFEENRNRFLSRFKDKSEAPAKSLLFFKGKIPIPIDHTGKMK